MLLADEADDTQNGENEMYNAHYAGKQFVRWTVTVIETTGAHQQYIRTARTQEAACSDVLGEYRNAGMIGLVQTINANRRYAVR